MNHTHGLPDLVDVYEAHESVEAGEALLVCAYDDEKKFEAVKLAGAISFPDLSARLGKLTSGQSIILYCA